MSVSKGDRIAVQGKLRVRDWDNGERAGTSVEIEADSIGHDLAWGNSAFTRTVLVRESEPEFDSTMDQTADESEPEVDSLEPELVGAKKR
jgi:single-strand DNA-binding protein